MRNAFAGELTELAGSNQKIILLSGDIGNRLFDEYKRKFPDRFFNCGVAEANMMGMAAGMAMSGLRPVTYTIASFAVIRCIEQIKIDICYHNQPVIIVGVGGGFSYAENGATHHACEDIAFMRELPNMSVICPCDQIEVKAALREAFKEKGPVYIRLGKKGEPAVHGETADFVVGKAIMLREGGDACIVATGNIVAAALQSANILAEKGISARVVSMHTVKPLDKEFLAEAFARYKIIATVEEHSVLGGLGGSIAEIYAAFKNPKGRLLIIGIPDSFSREAGRQEYARVKCGLTSQNIAQRIQEAIRT